MKNVIDTEESVPFPMEDVLGIEAGTTVISKKEVITDITPYKEYDEKDEEIEDQFQEVYNSALTEFENITEKVRDIEPKFRARNHEVAVAYLNTALNAAKEKASLKQTKEKMAAPKAGQKITNNNLIVEDRNQLLKAIMSGGEIAVNE